VQTAIDVALKAARQRGEDPNENVPGNVLGVVAVAGEAVSKPVNAC
jgi:hypothetical protein